MKSKRIIRDLLLLLGFCGTFFALLYVFGKLDGSDSDDIIDFSESRLRADRSQARKDWEGAKTNLVALIERDPYDGRAQFEYAMTLYKQRRIAVEKLKDLENSGKEDSPEAESLKAQVAETNSLAVEELAKAKEFARYRGRSLLFLSVLEAEEANWEKALDHLDEFVSCGNYTYDGLDFQARVFGEGGQEMADPGATINESTKLHQFGRFWDIVRREKANRERR